MSRIVVLGGAESGVGAAVLAKVKGFDVFLSDYGKISEHFADELRKWDIAFEEGHHTEDLILNADEVRESQALHLSSRRLRRRASTSSQKSNSQGVTTLRRKSA